MIVDSVSVQRVLAPSSTEELAEILRDEAGTIAPVGAGTQLAFGNPPEAIDCVVDTRGLSRITDYVPADLTIHVEAGVRLGQLEDTLGENNQMLPLDPWNGPEATVGGIVATNAQGPLRAVGTIRDWIIGMKVVHPGGRISRTGGRVVKNVSGYDLAKLYIGSLGSLAVISEVSFKLRARYQSTATARVQFSTVAAAGKTIRAIRNGPLDPISLVWTGRENRLYVRFGEHARAVDWQLDQLPGSDWERFDRDAEGAVWDEVRGFYEQLGEIVVRVVTVPSKIEDVLTRCQPSAWLAHAATGTILMATEADRISPLREQFPTIIERGPVEVRRRVPTFGLDDAEYGLMSRIKTAFDPDRRLNPGRHVDGERPQ